MLYSTVQTIKTSIATFKYNLSYKSFNSQWPVKDYYSSYPPFHKYFECLKNKKGLEISGPSSKFGKNGILPIYPIIAGLDNYSYPRSIEWGGRTINKGETFEYIKNAKKGYQFIGDSVDMAAIRSSSYDFIAASHIFEHIANPLKAFSEWVRVLNDNGTLLLIVPHKDATFDYRRPLTTLDHLIQDLNHNTQEDDRTHIPEFLRLTGKCHPQEWIDNIGQHRGLHHHVFDTKLMIDIFDHMKLQILSVDLVLPNHIIILGKKLPGKEKANNINFLSKRAECRTKSPFRSDRLNH